MMKKNIEKETIKEQMKRLVNYTIINYTKKNYNYNYISNVNFSKFTQYQKKIIIKTIKSYNPIIIIQKTFNNFCDTNINFCDSNSSLVLMIKYELMNDNNRKIYLFNNVQSIKRNIKLEQLKTNIKNKNIIKTERFIKRDTDSKRYINRQNKMIKFIGKSKIIKDYKTQRNSYKYFTIEDLLNYIIKKDIQKHFKNKNGGYDFNLNKLSLGKYINDLTDYCIFKKTNSFRLYKII